MTLACSCAVGEGFHHFDDGQKECQHDGADDAAEDDDHDGFEEADEGGDEDVDLVVVVVGDFEEHFVELAGFFADVDHVGDNGVADAGGTEWSGEGLAFADGVVDALQGAAVDAAADGVAGDLQGLEDGDAGGEECAQGAAEAGDGGFAEDFAEDGGVEFEVVEEEAAGF